MRLRGRILSFNRGTCWGEVGYDLEVLRFHSTSFYAERSHRWPVVGEDVEIVLNQSHELLAVRGS